MQSAAKREQLNRAVGRQLAERALPESLRLASLSAAAPGERPSAHCPLPASCLLARPHLAVGVLVDLAVDVLVDLPDAEPASCCWGYARLFSVPNSQIVYRVRYKVVHRAGGASGSRTSCATRGLLDCRCGGSLWLLYP